MEPLSTAGGLRLCHDIGLISVFTQHLQLKTNNVAVEIKEVGLNINKNKTKVMRVNSTYPEHTLLKNKALESVKMFCCLRSIVDKKKEEQMGM